MLTRWMTLLTAAVAGLATAGHAMDISQDLSEELAMGWKMGLRPRQNAQNLQFFDGKVGGAGAPGVRLRCDPLTNVVFCCSGTDERATNEQITQSNDPDRPFSVGGDTFVSSPSPWGAIVSSPWARLFDGRMLMRGGPPARL